ncbi:MAG: DNA recombination protein RmuC [Thermoanaerobaculia bacterium]
MLILATLSALVAGLIIGWLIASLRASKRLQSVGAEQQRSAAQRDLAVQERARADEELRTLREKLDSEQQSRTVAETRETEAARRIEELRGFVTQAQQQLEGVYAKLSREALEGAVAQIEKLVNPHLERNKGEIVSTLDAKKGEIDALLLPVREMLKSYQTELKESEVQRTQGYATLAQQIKQLFEATEATRKETSKVANALGNPKVSGTWGEQALQRCVELAGMSEYCDFDKQSTFDTKESGRIRPDLIVRLPGDRRIAVDSKAPMTAYLGAMAEADEGRQKEQLEQHAKNLRRHIDQLSNRLYHENIGESLDFTVLFLGGEQFLYSALIVDPSLFEYGAEKKVFIATPTVLVPLLRVVSAAWKAEQTEESAKKALEIGNDLYERFVKVFRDIESVGRSLESAVQKYNEAIRSIDSRLLPKAKELQGHVSSTRDLPDLAPVDAAIGESMKIGTRELTTIDES